MELLIIAVCIVLQTLGVMVYFGFVVPKVLEILFRIQEATEKVAASILSPEEAARRMQMQQLRNPHLPPMATKVEEKESFEEQMSEQADRFKREMGLI